VAVTAARLATPPRWSISRVLAELHHERQRLVNLSPEGDVSVRAAFDLSYGSLDPPVARCYRATGLHSGSAFGAAAIAAGLGVEPEHATSMLDALVEANLLGDVSDDRYQMHDLIRLHARRLAQDDPDRETMAGRIAEWYLTGTRAADEVLTPYRRRSPATFRYLNSTVDVPADRDEALAWLERERANLVATVIETAEPWPELSWLVADSMWPLFHLRRHHGDRMLVDRTAVECARRLGNPDHEARMVKRWAFAHFDLGRFEEAASLFRTSLELWRQLGDRYGVASAVEGLGMVALAQGRLPEAAEHFHEQLTICRTLGERRRVGLSLFNLGLVYAARGDPGRAADHLTQAGAAFAELGDTDSYNAVRSRIELGKALTELGRPEASGDLLTEAMQQMRRLGSPRGEAQALHALGRLALATGDSARAAAHLDEALRIYERLGDGEVAELRRLIGRIPPPKVDPDRMAEP
jgi:tetratricopeptide (TPR) repeat protein